MAEWFSTVSVWTSESDDSVFGIAEPDGNNGKLLSISVSDGLDNNGGDVPASESDGTCTGIGMGWTIGSGTESGAELFDNSVSSGGIASCSGNRGSIGGSDRRNSSSSCGCCRSLNRGEGISVSPSLSVSVSESEE